MIEETRELLKYRFERAVETLDVAKSLFNNSNYRDSNNRSYYAAFYAMKAVYSIEGRDYKKT